MESMHDFVVEQLQRTKGRWPEVAEGSGVPARTIEKIARRETENPRVSSIERLVRYFEANPA